MSILKNIVKTGLRRCGYELRKINPKASPSVQLVSALRRFEVDLVFDIGANVGQFAAETREAGYQGGIVSFEPLADAYERLCTRAAGDGRWQVHGRSAIGDHDGEIEINVSANSVSSSVLPMLESHTAAAVNSAYIGTETVPIQRLDTVAPSYLVSGSRHFVKIDTQGFEWQVLDGASETLAAARGVLCELSLLPLYEGQHLWREIIDRLEQTGFTLWAIQKGFTDPRDGRSLQLNGIFFRIS